jgi:lipid A 3-O-deacylase
MHRWAWAGAFTAVCLVSTASYGQGWIDEVRLGVYQHDSGIIGNHKEEGADLALEGLSRPVTLLSLIGTPRFVFGGVWNTAGQTDQIYLGIDKQLDFLHGAFTSNDAFFVEGTIGGVWHSGKHDVEGTPLEARWKSHGGSFLFRPGLALGYRFNERWSIAASLNHISNAGLASSNEGSNDLGVLLGWKL